MENQNQLTLQGILGKCLKWFLLLSISLFTAFPFIWMLISSLKTKAEVMNTEVIWPHIPQWGNYLEIFTQSPIPKYIWNSLWTSVVIVSSTISIFGIFLLRQAFMQVPRSLIEASRMDGASHFRVLWEIVCPMTKSSFITFGLMSFIAAYNSYMWPSLITNDQPKYLVSQGLRSFFIEGGAYGTEWAKVMAASSVIVLPLLVIFAFTQKWFINGIGGDTGVKG